MSCWMKCNLHAINRNGFTIANSLYLNIRTNSTFENRYCKMMTQVFLHSPACMIRMPMGDQSHIHRLPRINKKLAWHTVYSFGSKLNQSHMLLTSKGFICFWTAIKSKNYVYLKG